MTQKLRRIRDLETKFLRLYSAWQETHRLELVLICLSVFAELLKLNPHYSIRNPFQQAF